MVALVGKLDLVELFVALVWHLQNERAFLLPLDQAIKIALKSLTFVSVGPVTT